MTLNLDAMDLITWLDERDADALTGALEASTLRVFRLDGAQVTDKASFLSAAADCFPLAGETCTGWDGFRDALRDGLAQLGCSDVALMWTGVHRMLEGGLPALLAASDCLVGLARQVYSPAKTNFPRQIRLNIFYLGEGPNFEQRLAALPAASR